MKRDMDLIRRIVLTVRDSEGVVRGLEGVEFEVYAEHVRLLEEAGLVDASIQIVPQRRVIAALIWRLTWAGQDFASAIDNDTLWSKAKESVIKPAGSWTFDVLKEWLKAEILQGLPTIRRLGQ